MILQSANLDFNKDDTVIAEWMRNFPVEVFNMSPDLIQMCQQGWYDHDHCKKYSPMTDTKQEVSAYKKGWNHGSCK